MMSVLTDKPPLARARRYQLDSGLGRLTPAQRAERGRQVRAAVPRNSHAVFDPPADRPDPIALLEEQANLGTAAGTLVLAVATFASVRSANRAARAAERSMLEGLRPLLLPSRVGDLPEKVGFQDEHWVEVKGGHGTAEAIEQAVYFAIALRNVGHGLAVLNAWSFKPERLIGAAERPDVENFRCLTRDLYIPPRDLGFWQGAMRDPSEAAFAEAAKTINDRYPFTIDILYGDGDGGQRVISRFSLIPRDDGSWLAGLRTKSFPLFRDCLQEMAERSRRVFPFPVRAEPRPFRRPAGPLASASGYRQRLRSRAGTARRW